MLFLDGIFPHFWHKNLLASFVILYVFYNEGFFCRHRLFVYFLSFGSFMHDDVHMHAKVMEEGKRIEKRPFHTRYTYICTKNHRMFKMFNFLFTGTRIKKIN